MDIPNRKICKICKCNRDAGYFYKDKSSRDGLFGYCKDCSRIKVREWYTKQRDPNRPRKNARLSKAGMKLGDNKNKKYRKHLEGTCRRCGFTPEDVCQLTVDHIDKNRKNNNVNNLQTLCSNCHNLKTKVERLEPEKLLLLNLVPSTS